VVTPTAVVVREGGKDGIRASEPWWVDLMRLASGMKGKEE
jgi:hypothetical protein